MGTCALCNAKNIELTKEHIFPGTKQNHSRPFQAKIKDTISLTLSEGLPPSSFEKLKEEGLIHHEQGGTSLYSLCEKCNNNTGSWYGNAYIEWKNQWEQIIKSNLKQNPRGIEGKITFNPLRLLKQIISCFISIDYENHKGDLSIEDNLRNIQPELFDFVLAPEKRFSFNKFRIFVHLLPGNGCQAHYTSHIVAHNLILKKDQYPYTLNLIDGYIHYSLLFHTNSPYEPKYFGRHILDISKYGVYSDRETTKNLKLEEIEWIFKIQASLKTK